jgi:hypothetical protein
MDPATGPRADRQSCGDDESGGSAMRCQIVDLTGAFRSAGGWRVRPMMLELSRGGGSGELDIQPQARSLRGFCRAES